MRRRLAGISTLLGMGLACGATTTGVLASTEVDFFRGKTMTYVVATGVGGGYDFYGRLISRNMEKHLPGTKVVVRNMPGAGHLIGTNFIYNSKPDGLTIGSFSTGIIYGQLVGLKGIQFDLSRMSYIGKAASDPRVLVIGTNTPFKSFDDIRKSGEPVRLAASGVGGANFNEAYMVRNAHGVPFEVMAGYSGSAADLALMRGEVAGMFHGVASSLNLIQDGRAIWVAQFGGTLPDVPHGTDLATTPEAKAVARLMTNQSLLGRITAGPPAIPVGRLEAIRQAYRAALESQELRAEAGKARYPIEPAYGNDVLNMVTAALDQPPSVKKLLLELTEIRPPELKHKGPIVELGERGATISISADGQKREARVSGARTAITIGGQKAGRADFRTGMICEVTYPRQGAEATSIACEK